MKKENVSSLGTVVTALLAASCRIGPAIFAIFGTSIGFLGKLTVLDPLRPYLLSAAFAMFGYSFWKLYLRKSIPCDCEADRPPAGSPAASSGRVLRPRSLLFCSRK